MRIIIEKNPQNKNNKKKRENKNKTYFYLYGMYYSKRNKIIIYFLFIQTAKETHSERKSKTEKDKQQQKITKSNRN